MTLIDQFLAFAKSLPADKLAPVEDALGTIMATWSDDADFSDSELAELDRRLAEPKPEYSPQDEINDLLGKPFT